MQDLSPKSDPKPLLKDCVVSPLCLSVIAVSSQNGFLPCLHIHVDFNESTK